MENEMVKKILKDLEEGVETLFESDSYREYLDTMSRFHSYSYNNIMLIKLQNPEATLVAGYRTWQTNFERNVKKGEKGIRILAPAPYKVTKQREKIDTETGELVIGSNGQPVREDVQIEVNAFRVISVFDVSQTEGKELPQIPVSDLTANVEYYSDFLSVLDDISPLPISYEEMTGDKKGYMSRAEQRIAVRTGMSESQTLKTLIHEITHAKLHAVPAILSADKKDRSTKEVEAESVAYVVCRHFGIDTSDYSFGYIAGWSSGKEMKELKASLETICNTASEMINDIEDRLQERIPQLNPNYEAEREELQQLVDSDMKKYGQLNYGTMEKLDTLRYEVNDNIVTKTKKVTVAVESTEDYSEPECGFFTYQHDNGDKWIRYRLVTVGEDGALVPYPDKKTILISQNVLDSYIERNKSKLYIVSYDQILDLSFKKQSELEQAANMHDREPAKIEKIRR